MAKFVNPFPPLHLGYDDEQTLADLAAGLVDDCVAAFAAHLEETQGRHGQLDPHRWKHVKSREDVHVFQERPGFSKWTNAAGLPTLLAIGTIVGDLDDVMYGVVNPSLDLMRIKTSYVEDRIENAAVLASFVEPSVESPYRCLAVKWSVTRRNPLIRSLFKNRDSLYLESTGVSALASGDRIGYQLLHSVRFPQIGQAPGGETVRTSISMCCVYRQVAANAVQLYMRGYLDPAGGIARAIAISVAADVMASVWKNVECAHLKKLAWAIRRRRERSPTVQSDDRPKSDEGSAAAASRDTCALCGKRSLLGASRSATCRLCFDPVCRSCRVRKTLSFIGDDNGLLRERIAFCKLCFTRAISTNAYNVATDEILVNDTFRGYAAGSHETSPPSTIGSYSPNSRCEGFF